MSYLLAALVLGVLVIFHEFGHYWVARRSGMRVERFSIGFGPVLTSWKSGDTEFAISAIPLGGYVKIAGMATEDEVESEDQGNYANKPAWKRFLVIFAGPGANYLLAFVLGIGLMLAVHTVPETHWTKLGTVVEGMPAAVAGIKENDEVVSIDGVDVHDWDELRKAVASGGTKNQGKPFPVVFKRAGQAITVQMAPKDMGGGSFQIGVGPAEREIAPVGFGTAIIDSAQNLWLATAENFKLIGKLVTRQASVSALSGPIGIVSVTATAARRGPVELFWMVWQLSIAVGFINLMPIPGLDGGRCMFLIYELIVRRRVNQTVESWIHGVGLLLLFALILFVSYGDIVHLVRHG